MTDSVKFGEILYTRIGSTLTARAGNGSIYGPNAISSQATGQYEVIPFVNINGLIHVVVEIGMYSFNNCRYITNLALPETITILRERCFRFMLALQQLTIPSTVSLVETWFLESMGSLSNITFCGFTEPGMVNIDVDLYISTNYLGDISVPLDYNGDYFCKRSIIRLPIVCQSYYPAISDCNFDFPYYHYPLHFFACFVLSIILILK